MKLILKVTKALLLAAFVVITSQSYGQCNFQAGDIAFIGYNIYDSNTGATPNDKFSFVLLKDLPANTVVYFTDFGWTNANGFQNKTYSKSDGVLKWSNSVLTTAGTQVVINCKYTPTASVGTIDLAGSINTGNTDVSTPKEYISLGIQGDQLFAFTGSVAAPTLIAGITVNSSAWNNTLDPTRYTSSESLNPSALNSAQNTTVSNATSDAYNAKYNGPTFSGAASVILSAINYQNGTGSNWAKDNTAGAAPTAFELPLNYTFVVNPPTIVSNPVEGFICPGQSTSFTATANDACSYKWQVDKGDGNGFVYVSNGGVYSNATTTTLNISNVNGLHLYKYRMEAQGATTPLVYSAAAVLNVIQTPVISQHPQNVLAASGDNVTFSVNYTNNAIPTVQWQVSTNNGVSFTDIPSATGDNYSFTPTLAQDGYQYRAVVKNGCNLSATSTAAILTIKPQVTSIVRAGGAAQSTNSSSVNYTVTFSKTLTGVDASDFGLTTSGTLTGLSIGSVNAVSGNEYTVTVNTGNGDGSVRLDFNNITGVTPTAAATFTTGETFILDRTAPTGTIAINAGTPQTNNTNVILALTTNDATQMSFSNDGITWSAYENFSTSKSWTMTLGDGTKTVYVHLTDALGNEASFLDAIILDTTSPIVSGVTTGGYYNTDVSITFNEGTATLNGAAYTQGTSITASGSYVLTVTDAAGNVTIVNFVIDKTAPTVSIGSPSLASTNTGPVTYTVTYADANFAQSTLTATDVIVNSVGNANAGTINVSGSGLTRTITLSSITGDGTLGISIAANTASDLAGNMATVAGPSTIFIVDNTAPVTTFTSTPPVNTNSNGATFVFNNNEAGSSFEGSLDGATFTLITSPITLSGIADGTHTFKVRSKDALGNVESTPAFYTWTVDTTPPSVSIVSGPAAVSISTSALFNFASNEMGVTYEASLDLGTFATVTNPVTYSSLAEGVHTLRVRAVDGAGNTSSIQTYNWTIDATAPTVLSITRNTPSTAITNSTALVYNVDFSENVSGIDFSDFEIIKTGTASALINGVSGSTGTSITVSLFNVSGNGTIQLALKNSGTGIIDIAGNSIGVFSSGEIYTIDNTKPSVVLTTTASNPTNGSFTVTATFSEDVTGFTASDFSITNGIVNNFQSVDGKTYTFTVDPIAQGLVTINVNTGSAQDLAGNSNTGSSLSLTYDSTRPTVALSSASPVNINSAVNIQVDFSEVVAGFTESDITVVNGSISNLQTSDNKTYTATLTPASEGNILVSIAASVATDAAGNTNTGTTGSLAFIYDTGQPTVTLSTTGSGLINQAVTVTATFSESVTGLSVGDFVVSNGTVSNLQTADNITYTILITPSANGAVTVQIPAAVAKDAALNDNASSNTLTFTYDGSTPVVTSVNVPLADRYGPGSTLSFTVNFNEDIIVTGTPKLQVEVGAATVDAFYQSKSGTNALIFSYTVQSGDIDNNGIVINALVLNGGSIIDAATNNANLTLNSIGTLTSVLVDGVAPVINNNQVFSINENSSLNTLAAAVAITDAGNMGTLQNATITSSIDTDNDGVEAFRIDAQTGSLYVNDVDEFDYEKNQQFVVSLTISDGINTSAIQSVTINVNNVNEAPTALTLSANTIAENSAAGTTIGTLSTTDIDAGSTFAYSLVAGSGSTDNASFTIVGNELRAAASFDYETKNSYSVRVRTTDNGGSSFEQVFTISITDQNEAPTALTLSATTIAENSAAGTSIGTLSTTDVDAGSTFTYSLVAGAGSTDNASFTIVGNELQSAASFDFETKNSYSVRVRTTDNGGLSFEQAFIISVADQNEAPTALTLSANTVAENSAAGTTIGTLSTTDVDAGSTFTYSLVAGAGSTDNASFTIVGNELQTAASFDYETKNSYSVRIRTTDNDGLSFEQVFTISVTDQNDTPSTLALSNTTIAENSAAGTTVGTLSTTDEDSGSTFTYSLVAGVGSTDNTSFTIVGNELQAAASFDYETKNSYSVRIRTTDNGGSSFEQVFTISITDQNEAPTALTLSATTIAENSAAGTTIGTLSTTDVDAGSTFTYSLVAGAGSTDNASFTIVGNELQSAASFDYETKNSYSVRIRTTDNGGSSFEQVFTISITDQNEAPTVLALSASTITENSAAGTTIGTLSTTDEDAGSTFTYSLVAGAGSTDNASFTIVGNELQAAASFDYETKNSYSVRIRTTDNGGSSFEQVFTISVTDQNDTPTALALSANTIAENSAAGASIGTLSAADVDAGSTFTYSLVAGVGSTNNTSFTIVGNELQAAASFDYETKNSYSVRIRTTDNGGSSFEQVFTISITDQNEAPTALALSATIIAENSAAGATIGTLSTTDVDASSTFTYSLVAGVGSTDNASFTIVGNELQAAASFDFETQNSYSVRVRTTDNDGLSFEQVFTISIADQNDTPSALALSTNTVAENSAAGTTIGTLTTTDEDSGSTFTYSLVAGAGSTDNASFTIVGNGLRAAASFDYETKNSYSVRLRTTDNGGASFEQVFAISVTDQNEAPTALALSANTITENSAAGATIGTLTTTDVDAGSTFTYSLVGGVGSTDNASFNIVGNELQSAASFDFETKNSYSVRIRTIDNGGLSFEQTFTISVTDVDEAPTDLALSANVQLENNSIGNTIGTLSTSDPNPSATFTYSLVPGASDNASFSIVGNELKANVVFDYEMKNTYSIRIRTTNNKGLNFEKTISVLITDQAESPTALNLSNNVINENGNAGSLVGLLTAVDQDAGSTFSYTLVAGSGDIGNGQFTIVGNELRTAASFDYELQNNYSIRIRVTDNSGLSLEKNIAINVNDINEAPTLDVIAGIEVCASSDEEMVALTGISAGPETNQSYTLTVSSDNDIFKKLSVDKAANGKSIVRFVLKDGATGTANITVTVTDNGGKANGGIDSFKCSFNVTVNTTSDLTVSSNNPTKISKGDVLELTANGLFSSFNWNIEEGIIGATDRKVLKVRPMQTTTYKVKGTTAKGCSVWAEITVEVVEDFKLNATNVITPNDDGHNDKWLVRNIESYPNNVVKIFDRAGRVIYTQKGYANEWDGTMNGQPLHEDTYYYVIDLGNGAKLYKGYITIVRD